MLDALDACIIFFHIIDRLPAAPPPALSPGAEAAGPRSRIILRWGTIDLHI